ncbi:hypothetical protein [Calidifontibacter terrae]
MVGLSEQQPLASRSAPEWAAAVRRNAVTIEAALAGARASGADDAALGAALREVGPAFDAYIGRHHLDADRWAVAMASLVGRLLADGQLRQGSPRRWVLTTLLPTLGGDLSRTTPQLLADLTTAAGRLAGMANLDLWGARLAAATDAAGSLTDEGVRELGLLAAWRAGQVRLRDEALRLAEQKPAAVLDAVLGTPQAREALRVNAVHPLEWPSGAPWPRSVGGFTGFGGPWRQLPVVVGGDGHRWSVRSGAQWWMVLTDAFGAAIIPDNSSAPPTAEVGEVGEASEDVTGSVIAAGAILASSRSSYSLRLFSVG